MSWVPVFIIVFELWLMSVTLVGAPDTNEVLGSAAKVLAYTKARPNIDSFVIVPVHHTGCQACTPLYRAGDSLLGACVTKGFTLVFAAPVNRYNQWATLNKSGSYPVRTVPDIAHQLTRIIGSTIHSPRALVVVGRRYRIVPLSTDSLCGAMAELTARIR